MLFSNNRDNTFCYSNAADNRYELSTNEAGDYGAVVWQSKLSGYNSFCPNIQQFYIQIDQKKFPHTTGLTDVTAAELKKIAEKVEGGHLDIIPLWWFSSTDFYLLTNFGHGNLYGW